MGLHSILGENQAFDRNHAPLNAGQTWVNPIRDGNSNNVPQILIGYQKDGFGTGKDYGIKVSKPTVDVRTATDINTVMSSAYRNFKIVAYGTTSFTKNASSTTATTFVAHNLGYTPAVSSFATILTTYRPLPYFTINTTTGIVDLAIMSEVDNTNLNLYCYTPSSGSQYAFSIAVNVTYYLYIETAT